MHPIPGKAEPRMRHVCALGVAQTLAWASSYYLPAVLAAPMARDLGVGKATVFAAMSHALGDDLRESVEHRAGEAFATVLGDEHEVITKRIAAVVELVDAHGAAR